MSEDEDDNLPLVVPLSREGEITWLAIGAPVEDDDDDDDDDDVAATIASCTSVFSVVCESRRCGASLSFRTAGLVEAKQGETAEAGWILLGTEGESGIVEK